MQDKKAEYDEKMGAEAYEEKQRYDKEQKRLAELAETKEKLGIK
jgi:hypothetical protein